MKYRLAEDAKPQLKLLLLATFVTIALWFIPFAEWLVYPVRLFVTFIHEASHALVALLTGGSVQSLAVSSDGAGLVTAVPSGTISSLLTSSAGYLGTTFFGVLLLFLIRRAISPGIVLYGLGGFIGLMTLVFGFLVSLLNVSDERVTLAGIGFTTLAGAALSAALLAIARFGSLRATSFTVAFLAVQLILNAFLDLKTVFFLNAPFSGSEIQTDATNMYEATGLPAAAWILIWILLSVVMISVGLRLYAVSQKGKQNDLPFED
ncbi:MAG: M50 family metallopeptidase [Acidobacteriota bacterium]|nr:M50 family metallopeptidase [Acidobacteriota bacterium]